jgi:hypothetical protein
MTEMSADIEALGATMHGSIDLSVNVQPWEQRCMALHQEIDAVETEIPRLQALPAVLQGETFDDWDAEFHELRESLNRMEQSSGWDLTFH